MFTAFPIYDSKYGKITAKDAWLLPVGAYQSIENGHLKRGVLERRKGKILHGQLIHTNTTTGVNANYTGAVMGLPNYYNDLTETLLACSTDRINKYNTSTGTFEDLTRKKLHVVVVAGQNALPAAGQTVKDATTGATATIEAVVVDYGSFTGGTGHGTIVLENGSISGTFTNGNNLVNNADPTKIFGKLDGTADEQEFTGDESNFFVGQNWNNVVYLTNNKDQIQKYDGTALSRLYIDLDVEGGSDNDVNSCMFIFNYKSRLLILRTTERSEFYPVRARWSEVNSPNIWKEANYVDCPISGDYIIAADFVGDDLIVWFSRSIWKLIYTGDADLPFRWERVEASEEIAAIIGCVAQNSLTTVNGISTALGPTNLIETDGRIIRFVDSAIPEEVISWDSSNSQYAYGMLVYENNQIYLSYNSQDASDNYPDKILVRNFTDNSFSNYSMPVHCFGASKVEGDLILDNINDVLDTLDYSFDDKSLQAGYATVLAGGRDGCVYRLNITNTDNGTPIKFSAKTGELNPYIIENYEAELGYIDIFADVDATTTLNIKNYIGTSSDIILSQDVTFASSGIDQKKIWKRVYCNITAKSHVIELNCESGGSLRIHAIVPYFRKAGELL